MHVLSGKMLIELTRGNATFSVVIAPFHTIKRKRRNRNCPNFLVLLWANWVSPDFTKMIWTQTNNNTGILMAQSETAISLSFKEKLGKKKRHNSL